MSDGLQVTRDLEAVPQALGVSDTPVALSQNIVFVPALSVPQAAALLAALSGRPAPRLVEGGAAEGDGGAGRPTTPGP